MMVDICKLSEKERRRVANLLQELFEITLLAHTPKGVWIFTNHSVLGEPLRQIILKVLWERYEYEVEGQGDRVNVVLTKKFNWFVFKLRSLASRWKFNDNKKQNPTLS